MRFRPPNFPLVVLGASKNRFLPEGWGVCRGIYGGTPSSQSNRGDQPMELVSLSFVCHLFEFRSCLGLICYFPIIHCFWEIRFSPVHADSITVRDGCLKCGAAMIQATIVVDC